MKTEARQIAKTIVQVKLTPETASEIELLKENIDTDVIEIYYREAVNRILPDYVMHEVIDQSKWPYAAEVRVERIIGIG